MTKLSVALAAMDEAGIPFRFRKNSQSDMDLSQGGEVDLEVEPLYLPSLDATMRSAGFQRVVAPGHEAHRFYVACSEGSWIKLDVRVRGRANRGWLRALPPTIRRSGAIVAILGPDGAGKSTVIAALRDRIPLATHVAYLGERRGRGSNQAAAGEPPVVRELAWLIVRWFRQLRSLLRVHVYAWRGWIVLCDRHPIEICAVRPRRTRIGRPLEMLLVTRLLPRPDEIVLLDAPADVLRARKDEHPIDRLERWRRDYREELMPRGATVVSSTKGMEETVADVSQRVWSALAQRRRW